MLSYSQNILFTLTGKSSLNDVTEEELKKITENYPYFGAAQFLFAKKLHADKHSDKKNEYKTALQKSALHFTNTLWLNYNFLEEIPVIDAGSFTDDNTSQAETLPEQINVDAPQAQKPAAFAEDNLSETEAIKPTEIIVEKQTEEKITAPGEDHSTITNKNNTEVSKESFSESGIQQDEEGITQIGDEQTESNERLSNLLKEQAAAFENPVEETALPIETTAYHRIDYFESQGIKLEQDKANDKLGSQVKRFTDWLKQMKRISPNLTNIETDAAGESQVQNMAEHSNEPKEIVTEAMAEVLVKQGKPQQAIAIFEKLSFINPSKSAYFAAKIQKLKA